MATLTAGGLGINMGLSSFFSPISNYSLSPTEIGVAYASGEYGLYGGNFSSNGTSLLGGAATSYAQFTGLGEAEYVVTNAFLPVSVFQLDYAAGNFAALEQYILQGHDTYIGTTGNDAFYGIGGNDLFIGGAGTELFEGSRGNNVFNGGTGIDADVYPLGFANYGISVSAGGTSATIATSTGTDLLSNMDRIIFADGALIIGQHDPGYQAYRLYQAAFDRLPDTGGLKFWASEITQAAVSPGQGIPIGQAAATFAASAEFAGEYGNLTDGAFISQIYVNVLGRPSDAGGAAFWESYLSQGHTRGDLLLQFSESSENIAGVAAHVTGGIWIGA